jgi:hypothetical protein
MKLLSKSNNLIESELKNRNKTEQQRKFKNNIEPKWKDNNINER